MITDEQVRRIALFFLFSLMDEKVALQAAQKTIAHLKATKTPMPGVPHTDSEIVAVLRKQHTHHGKLLPRNRPTTLPETAWKLPSGIDLESWARFQKDAPEPEIIAVLLSKILGVGDEALAKGLNVSLGTARYRIGKGIRQLGTLAKTKA